MPIFVLPPTVTPSCPLDVEMGHHLTAIAFTTQRSLLVSPCGSHEQRPCERHWVLFPSNFGILVVLSQGGGGVHHQEPFDLGVAPHPYIAGWVCVHKLTDAHAHARAPPTGFSLCAHNVHVHQAHCTAALYTGSVA